MDVDPFVVESEGVSTGAFVAEADLLVDMAGAGVERVDLQGDAVEPELLESVLDGEAGCFGAEASAAASLADEGAKSGGLIVFVPVVEHDLAEHGVNRPGFDAVSL